MTTLPQVLLSRFEADFGGDNLWYSWRKLNRSRLPARPISDVPIPPEGASEYELNVALKFRLSSQFAGANEQERVTLTRYYVKEWGGIRRTKEEKIKAYATDPPALIMARGSDGIPSWSKALSLRDPRRYAIFDARVAAALNALQIISPPTSPILYPTLPSQNNVIKSFQAWTRLRAAELRWNVTAEGTLYEDYLALLSSVSTAAGCEIYSVEMWLFAKAETLAEEASRAAT